jgi:hypothetical protein
MVAADVETTGFAPSAGAGCLGGGDRLSHRPAEDLTDERLAIRVSYAGCTSKPVRVVVDAVDPERPFRSLELRPFEYDAELVDLGTTRLHAMTIQPSAGDTLCLARLDIGSLNSRD